MKLFGQIVRTLVNVVMLPAEILKDAVTLGGIITEQQQPYTVRRLEKLAEDAEEQP